MNNDQKLFLVVSLIGGTLVLASYYFGLKGGESTDALWGGTPENIRTLYTISMLVSAAGYLVFMGYIFKNLGSLPFITMQPFGSKQFTVLLSLILVASALWIPLVNLMITNPTAILWVAIRVVLAVVGLASGGIVITLLTVNPRPTDVWYCVVLVGMIWFTVHTGVLDAILWPYFWGMGDKVI